MAYSVLDSVVSAWGYRREGGLQVYDLECFVVNALRYQRGVI